MFTKKLFRHRSENPGKPAARQRENGLLHGDSRVAVIVCGIAALFLVRTSGYATTMVWETNNFNGGAGNWTITYNNSANGNNVDWRNSSLAGGTGGEIGGTFARHTSAAFFGRLLDFTVTLNDPMHMRGVFSSTNTALTWNSSVSIGYFNSAEALADNPANYVVWRNREPNVGGTENYRARARISAQAQQNSPALTFVQGQSYTFDVEWIPSGLNDGSGTFQGNIGGSGPPTGTNFWTFSQILGAQSSGPGFDAFGLWWDESAIDPTVTFDAYFDNFEYLVPVPEPSPALLASGGMLVLWLANRLRRARCR